MLSSDPRSTTYELNGLEQESYLNSSVFNPIILEVGLPETPASEGFGRGKVHSCTSNYAAPTMCQILLLGA